MPNYQNGKIYKLTGINAEGIELIYIGSTTQQLSQRLGEHKRDFRNNNSCSSKIIFECCNNSLITLLENFSCSSIEELKAQERCWYEKFNCVNKYKPNRTTEDKIEINLLYNQQRRELKQTCICGSTFVKCQTKRHEQSKKHIEYVEQKLSM